MKQSRIEKILLSLASGQVDIGWAMFLDAYSDLLHSIACQFESSGSGADDCYEFVCARLSDNDFRRLRSFNPVGPARFRTWLTTVTANLCKDWLRSVYGRQRQPGFLQDVSELEQLVFRYLFRHGMTHHECLHVLQGRYPRLEADEVRRINGELYDSLTRDQRWQIGVRRHDTVAAEDVNLTAGGTFDPEREIQQNQDRECY